MLDDIAPVLRTFFLPQIEQMGAVSRPSRFGYLGAARSEDTRANVWAAPIGNDCLISTHDISVGRKLHVVEEPGSDYLCICSISSAAVPYCPAPARPSRMRPRENVMMFMQSAGSIAFDMWPGFSYACTSVCLLPDYFERMARSFPGDAGELASELVALAPDDLPASFRSLLRALSPRPEAPQGYGPTRSALFYHAKVLELTAELAELAQARRHACEQDGDRGQLLFARRARELIDAGLPGQVPTIDALARELSVGRSQLCAAFKHVMGTGIGAYARGRRMELACELLATTELPVAEIARRVGYERAGSFTEAFEAARGATPTAWRAKQR